MVLISPLVKTTHYPSGFLRIRGKDDPFIGWSAVEDAAPEGHLRILKRLGPDPARDDFDNLDQYARYESVVAFLATIHPPRDLTSILSWHLRRMAAPHPRA